MLYNDFQGESLSRLGFGTMRLPTVTGDPNAPVDEKTTFAMVDYALDHGVNYFDTARPYHGGASEPILGRALARHPRDRFFLATKFPGHQISAGYDPAAVFEDQLKKCQVSYFDFYLLHNVYERSIHTYQDPRWGILDYFLEQKRRGRIRHLGFSSHGGLDILDSFLDYCQGQMEFCQIQLNYLDWTLQDAQAKYALLTRRGVPVWVMEPVRGGRLAKLSPEAEAQLKALRPRESIAAWGFRYLMGLPNVKIILSGMSDLAQMEDNVATFSQDLPLSPQERELLHTLAESMKNSIPCTGCRYCCDGCPVGLNIPMLLGVYNELRFSPAVNASMRVEALPEEKRPAACLACGKCARICPQGIDVPRAMKELNTLLETLPTWAEVCRQRDEAQARRKG